jgi:fructose-1,6-bisphosphatase
MYKLDIQELETKNRGIQNELLKLKAEFNRPEPDNMGNKVANLEDKINIINKEKKRLEGLVAKIQEAVPIIEMKRIISELLRNQSDFTMEEREKARIEGELT